MTAKVFTRRKAAHVDKSAAPVNIPLPTRSAIAKSSNEAWIASAAQSRREITATGFRQALQGGDLPPGMQAVGSGI